MRKTIVVSAAILLIAGSAFAAEWRAPKDSYGAIAAARDNAGVGLAINIDNAEEASRRALAQCEAQAGGKACQVRIHFKNACAAVAQGGNNHAGYAWGSTPEKAAEEAMSSCTTAARGNCQITHSMCSLSRPATAETLGQDTPPAATAPAN